MKFSSNGKLLITGEYLVLDGAKSLALPTNFGQDLHVEINNSNILSWRSFDEQNDIWFNAEFEIKNSKILSRTHNDKEVSQRLIQIFEAIQTLNPNFLKSQKGFHIKTKQDFNRKWGLGTSSTLINNMAQWINVDAYKLLELTFGGSGYDIACAQNNTAITYQLDRDYRKVEAVTFNPSFKDHIYFVYLNQKQNSRDGISAYKTFKGDLSDSICRVNTITETMLLCNTLSKFKALITEHENIISKIINQQPVKERLFNDFDGAIKSLGAWGGDFVLVTSTENPEDYFKAKGYDVVIPFDEMIKLS